MKLFTNQDIIGIIGEHPDISSTEVAKRLPQKYRRFRVQCSDVFTRLHILEMRGTIIRTSDDPKCWRCARE